MDIQRILKITRNYRGLFDERIATWLYRRYVKDQSYSGITWFDKESLAIYFSNKEYIERRVWMMGEYETEVLKAFEISVKKNAIVLDIGANIGINAMRLSKLVGDNGKVYAFEPIPFNQQRFKKNIQLNKITNITLMEFALGQHNEQVIISIDDKEENMGAISLRNPTEHGIAIEVRNGDEWVLQNNIEKIDFMKIDVEGFEWNVINGFSESIKKYHPTILLEWDTNYLSLVGADMNNWDEFITKNNYKILQVDRYQLVDVKNIKKAKEGNLLLV